MLERSALKPLAVFDDRFPPPFPTVISFTIASTVNVLTPSIDCAVVKSTKFFVLLPVPPLATAKVVPFQTPAVIVPTLVKFELTTFDARVVPVRVPAFAAIVISAVPSNATPLIFLGVAN